MIDARHQYLFSSVAAKLGLEDAEVEEAMLDGDQVNNKQFYHAHHCETLLGFTHAPTGDYNGRLLFSKWFSLPLVLL